MKMFRKAERCKAKLRLGITGPAGSGKTYSALQIAFGIGGRVAVIDTENRSADLYAHLGEYDVCTIEAPYTVQKYLAAINEAESLGYDILIIDSLTHAWAGEGGLLDQQGKIADSGKGNSYTAWRQVTPWHNKLVDAILQSPCHIIATMRSKMEYVLSTNDKGKQEPKKVGMAPVQRDGMEYEFTTVFDLSHNHAAQASKDRTGLFDGQIFTPSTDTGKMLLDWLESGADAPEPTITNDIQGLNTEQVQQTFPGSKPVNNLASDRAAIWNTLTKKMHYSNKEAKDIIIGVTGKKSGKELTAEDVAALQEHIATKLMPPQEDDVEQGELIDDLQGLEEGTANA